MEVSTIGDCSDLFRLMEAGAAGGQQRAAGGQDGSGLGGGAPGGSGGWVGVFDSEEFRAVQAAKLTLLRLCSMLFRRLSKVGGGGSGGLGGEQSTSNARWW